MDMSTFLQQIFEALAKATELAISNRKAIDALTSSQSELTAKLAEATADDESDTAKIAAFEEEKAKQDAVIADMVSKLAELKSQLEATPPVEPSNPLPPPVEPAPSPEPVSEVPPVVVEPSPEAPTPVVAAPATMGVTESVILPGSVPQIF